MKPGQMVKLRGYGNEELVRRVLRLDKDIVVVCRQDEYEKAQSERREPLGVGFHISEVLNAEPIVVSSNRNKVQ